MTDGDKKHASSFGSSLLQGAHGLNDAPKPKKAAPQVRIARGTYANMMSTRILKGLGVGLAVLLIAYLTFAVTIVRVLPTTTVGMLPVKNVTFEGGNAPAGAVVAVSLTEAQGSELLDYLAQSFVPRSDVALVKVIAGPWGTYGAASGVITVNDEIVQGVTLATEGGDQKLESEYLVECLEGPCAPGQAFELPSGNLMGIPLGGDN